MNLEQQKMSQPALLKNREKYKTQNCRVFHQELVCAYGSRCLFRHEFRSFEKIHRHYYQCHLTTVELRAEAILSSETDNTQTTEAPVKRLSLFEGITSASIEDEKLTYSSYSHKADEFCSEDDNQTTHESHNSLTSPARSVFSEESNDFTGNFDQSDSQADQEWPMFDPSEVTFFLLGE